MEYKKPTCKMAASAVVVIANNYRVLQTKGRNTSI